MSLKLKSKNTFVYYHCISEKHFVNLGPVITSYLLKLDDTQTHIIELPEYASFAIATYYVM